GVQGTLRCGVFSCFTLERPWLNNQRRVSCIPAGTYKGRVLPSPRFGIDLPELLDVPGRDQILIHPGNTIDDTEGCILIGLDRDESEPRIMRSRKALAALFEAIGDAREFWVNVRAEDAE
ncbi:MAG: DUF5675 family protein, partial [Desulfovibrionaceae bacterium]|nr:DUF5675 family protein [Desulfovibrionaceae bacterium]